METNHFVRLLIRTGESEVRSHIGFPPPAPAWTHPLCGKGLPASVRMEGTHIYPLEETGFSVEKPKTRTKCLVPLVPTTAAKSKQFSLAEVFVADIHKLYFGVTLAGTFKSASQLVFLCSCWTKPSQRHTLSCLLRHFPLQASLAFVSFVLTYCPETFMLFPHALLAVIQQSKKQMHPFKLSSLPSIVSLHVACVFSNEYWVWYHNDEYHISVRVDEGHQ